MSWQSYGTFVAFVVVVVLAPGPDLAVTIRSALAGGRTRGVWTIVGITVSNLVQGTAAALGLGAVIAGSHELFTAIRWAGIAYLCWLAFGAFRSAWRGTYTGSYAAEPGRATALAGLRAGFLSNITNPKVLVFFLAVLPQFLVPGSATIYVLGLAWTLGLIGAVYLFAVVWLVDRARAWLGRRRVRRALDTGTGLALGFFAVRLAVSD